MFIIRCTQLLLHLLVFVNMVDIKGGNRDRCCMHCLMCSSTTRMYFITTVDFEIDTLL